MPVLRSLYLLFTARMLALVCLAVASTYICRELQFFMDFPMSAVVTATVFPIVFAINAAYQRRETALVEYGSIQAHAQSLHFATRDWMDAPVPELVEQSKAHITEIFKSLELLLTSSPSDVRKNQTRIYREFSNLSQFVSLRFREQGLSPSEISRANQYLSKMLASFEVLQTIYQYRTPISLRVFSHLFIVLLPLIFGPYFAHLNHGYDSVLSYVPPALFTLVVAALAEIQAHLESPFDQVGEDDIRLGIDDYLARLDL